jgi:hypothetical protein
MAKEWIISDVLVSPEDGFCTVAVKNIKNGIITLWEIKPADNGQLVVKRVNTGEPDGQIPATK